MITVDVGNGTHTDCYTVQQPVQSDRCCSALTQQCQGRTALDPSSMLRRLIAKI